MKYPIISAGGMKSPGEATDEILTSKNLRILLLPMKSKIKRRFTVALDSAYPFRRFPDTAERLATP